LYIRKHIFFNLKLHKIMQTQCFIKVPSFCP
jgi:hypothetical protein